MSNKKPELYLDESGNPKGYRVGISDGVYGICPFCGKKYTEEDIQTGSVNFEHIYSRFGVKKAIDEKKVFPKIESEFMVAVHKDCNDRGSNELEKQVSRIINNLNKPRVQLTREDAQYLINYCIKTSIFLRYLFLWDDTQDIFCYEQEKLKAIRNPGLRFYKDFSIRIRHVDKSAGIYWGVDTGNSGKYCFSIVINDIEISYFYYSWAYKYEDSRAIFIEIIANHLIVLLSGDEYETFLITHEHLHRDKIPWSLEKISPALSMYNNSIGTLADVYDDTFNVSKNYFIRQEKLSKMSPVRLEKGEIGQLDKGVVFYRNGQIYFVNNDGVVQNIVDVPKGTIIPTICFIKNERIPHFPYISELKISNDFVVKGAGLESLEGVPKDIQGHVDVRRNKLTTLNGGPTHVGGSYFCDFNKLVSLKGAPKYVGGDFSCEHNELSTLVGGPQKVEHVFICRNNKLTSLKGAPKRVTGFFTCINNKIKTFDCGNTEINGDFYFDAKYLESLRGLPKAKRYWVVDCDENFDTAEDLKIWFKKYKELLPKGKVFISVQKRERLLHEATLRAKVLAADNTTDLLVPDNQHEK